MKNPQMLHSFLFFKKKGHINVLKTVPPNAYGISTEEIAKDSKAKIYLAKYKPNVASVSELWGEK